FNQKQIHSIKLVNVHFWLHTIGVVFYIVSMWISGVMQGLMWRATNADGTLTYSFVESVQASYPFWTGRFIGGLFIITGMLLMAYNCYQTIRAGRRETAAGNVVQTA
ncbi:MAG: cbb3-type cytochrome c oxidase subunit I, partial [Pseudomonadota bacterium]|nr:cbb3-type cytochrome c oxidase subunit I [Pseudomonadota bacterium]